MNYKESDLSQLDALDMWHQRLHQPQTDEGASSQLQRWRQLAHQLVTRKMAGLRAQQMLPHFEPVKSKINP